MINAKRKGNKGENNFSNYLRDNGIRAWRDGGSGGGNREKSDVGNDIGCTFEIKTVKKLNLFDAWKQARRAAELTHTVPHVVVHFDGMADGEWLVVIDNHRWLELTLPTIDPFKVALFKAKESSVKKSMKEKSTPQCVPHRMRNCSVCHLPVVRQKRPKKPLKKDSGVRTIG